MTATVVHLDSHRRNREQTRTAAPCCCRDGWRCFPHRVADAVAAMRADLAETEGELLVSRARFAETLETALPTLEAIVTECLPDERNAR